MSAICSYVRPNNSRLAIPLLSIRNVRKLVGREFADRVKCEPVGACFVDEFGAVLYRCWISCWQSGNRTEYRLIADACLSPLRDNLTFRPILSVTRADCAKADVSICQIQSVVGGTLCV